MVREKTYFDANMKVNREQAEQALDILSNCYKNDKRKSIHFYTFAKCCLQLYEEYHDENPISFIGLIINYIN